MKNKNLAQVFHFDLYGKREDKYDFLDENSLQSIAWNSLEPNEPNFFLVEKDFDAMEEYQKGIKVNELFPVNNVGIVTSRDSFVIDESKMLLENRINDFFLLESEILKNKYQLKENQSWKINEVKSKALIFSLNNIKPISYRPFDNRFVYYNDFFIERSRKEVMQHFLNGENVGLSLCKQFKSGDNYVHTFISNQIIESSYVSNKTSEITSILPLYLYPEKTTQTSLDAQEERVPNLNMEIVKQIAEKTGLTFTNEKDTSTSSVSVGVGSVSVGVGSVSGSVGEPVELAPIDILDYIYAVLHSPTYREKYKEFLKIDFPRVPYPKDAATFWQLVNLGSQIRQIHLLESPTVEKYITQYPIDGDNVVIKPVYKDGKVYINDTQYFANVPLVAWEFYIGGYQPAQKWLKDRKDRTLEFDDILHYQKIIVALSETDRLMKAINQIAIE
jgi:predicted helicase